MIPNLSYNLVLLFWTFKVKSPRECTRTCSVNIFILVNAQTKQSHPPLPALVIGPVYFRKVFYPWKNARELSFGASAWMPMPALTQFDLWIEWIPPSLLHIHNSPWALARINIVYTQCDLLPISTRCFCKWIHYCETCNVEPSHVVSMVIFCIYTALTLWNEHWVEWCYTKFKTVYNIT